MDQGSCRSYGVLGAALFAHQIHERSLEDLTDELEALLLDAVRIRLIADVPLGLFLSGGIDSNLICALAAKVAPGKLDTYTIAFDSERAQRGRAGRCGRRATWGCGSPVSGG